MSSQVLFEGLSPREWWPLATEAESRGMTVRALLAERDAPVVVPVSPLQQLTVELTAARASGFRVPRRELSPEERAWWAGEKRRLNLESFRRMEVEWTEIPA